MNPLKRIEALTFDALGRLDWNYKRAIVFLSLCFFPIILVLVLDPKSFTMSWNEGRGGFLFAFILLIAEYFVEGNSLQSMQNKQKTVLLLGVLAAVSLYFILSVFFGLQQYLLNLGVLFGVASWNYSWAWAWDYIVFGLYLTIVLFLCWGLVGLKRMATAIIYSFGMVIILLLDAVFPYDSLGPLQYIVPSMLYIDLALLRLIGVGAAVYSYPNFLTLPTRRGPFSLAVYWPSAGVHSMIIYSLIMLAFLIKIPLSKEKRITYFAIGAIGTFFVNILRIFLLSSYVVFVSSEVAKFEEFHATIGEVMFLPWVAGYILLVTWLASRKKG